MKIQTGIGHFPPELTKRASPSISIKNAPICRLLVSLNLKLCNETTKYLLLSPGNSAMGASVEVCKPHTLLNQQ